MHDAIRRAPFAVVASVANVASEAPQVAVTQLPLVLSTGDAADGEFGTLYGHFAANNAHGTDLLQRAATEAVPVLCVFTVADDYVSPAWYPEKHTTAAGKVVPTWNYAAVHARGVVEAVPEGAATRAVLARLTDFMERRRYAADPAKVPTWAVSDAPAKYIETQMRHIRAFRVRVTCLEGSWKLSQNKAPASQAAVASGMASLQRGAPHPGDTVPALMRSNL